MSVFDTLQGWFRQPTAADAYQLQAEYQSEELAEARAMLQRATRALEHQAELGFDAAERDNARWDWSTTRSGPNSVITSAGDALVARARDLDRNNALARRACSSLATNLVGDGIRVKVDGLSDEEERRFSYLWERFVAECSTSSDANLYTLQHQAALTMFRDGDSLVRRRPRRLADGLAVPVQLQSLEVDMLDTTVDGAGRESQGGIVVAGIEFDALDRRTGYHLHRHHPRESAHFRAGVGVSSTFVRAADVAHLFDSSRARPGQVKGVPWLHAVMNTLRDLEDYNTAEIVRKKGEACFVAAMTVDEDEQEQTGLDARKPGGGYFTDADGKRVDRITPGLMFVGRNGKSIEFNRPGPAVGVEEFERTRQRNIAAGALIPYSLLTGDLSDVNYSSIRAGLNEFRQMIKAFRSQVFIPMWCDPVYRWFLASSVASGRLPKREPAVTIPGYADPYFGYAPTWSAPAFQSVDRLKDAEADLLELRAGLASLPEILHNRGKSIEQVIDGLARFYELASKHGAVLDSDARVAWRKGAEGASGAKPDNQGA